MLHVTPASPAARLFRQQAHRTWVAGQRGEGDSERWRALGVSAASRRVGGREDNCRRDRGRGAHASGLPRDRWHTGEGLGGIGGVLAAAHGAGCPAAGSLGQAHAAASDAGRAGADACYFQAMGALRATLRCSRYCGAQLHRSREQLPGQQGLGAGPAAVALPGALNRQGQEFQARVAVPVAAQAKVACAVAAAGTALHGIVRGGGVHVRCVWWARRQPGRRAGGWTGTQGSWVPQAAISCRRACSALLLAPSYPPAHPPGRQGRTGRRCPARAGG